jgi:predicted enzyme related to lactoylglutathione lyase
MNRPVHFEILANDPVALSEFYHQALGWEIATWPGGDQTYWLATTGVEGDPGINGGFMGRELPQSVINTIEVEKLEPVLDRILKLGGKIVHGPNQVPGVGKHAYCADPEGILFGVMESQAEEGG